ncbi:hypothetical protein D3C77_706230 [compost metagenome]
MARVGHTSSQRPQKMQRAMESSQRRSPVSRSVSMISALAGQALVQAAQAMHLSAWYSGLPRKSRFTS